MLALADWAQRARENTKNSALWLAGFRVPLGHLNIFFCFFIFEHFCNTMEEFGLDDHLVHIE